MKIYAYLGIFDAVAKLGVTYLIYFVNDKLIVYAWLYCAVQIIPKIVLAIYCAKKYPEVKHRFVWDKSLLRELLGFTGWNIYGATVWMLNGQGINILLNMCSGPIVNAANGIAHQVNNAVTNFSTNFFTAARPQIIKSYASGEHQSLINLIYSSSRFSCYLLWAMSLPIILRCKYILSIWLIEVPEYTTIFVQWVLVYTIVNSFNNPVWTAMTATGNIKRSVLIGSNLFLLAFPISYVALKMGAAPYCVFPILSLGRFAFLLTTLFYLSKYIQISFTNYFTNVLIPIGLVISTSLVCTGLINSFLPQNFTSLLAVIAISLIINGITIYALGISKSERKSALTLISKLRNRFS
jgi:O-antigen/teichoic acid export membrane protein